MKTNLVERAKALRWYHAHRQHSKKRMLAYRAKRRKILNRQSLDYYHLARLTVLAYYSDGTLTCGCCGEDRYEFLTIEHTKGGGTQHLKQVGHALAYWLIKKNFPKHFAVLCYNCNCARGAWGYCPHKKEETNAAVA